MPGCVARGRAVDRQLPASRCACSASGTRRAFPIGRPLARCCVWTDPLLTVTVPIHPIACAVSFQVRATAATTEPGSPRPPSCSFSCSSHRSSTVQGRPRCAVTCTGGLPWTPREPEQRTLNPWVPGSIAVGGGMVDEMVINDRDDDAASRVQASSAVTALVGAETLAGCAARRSAGTTAAGAARRAGPTLTLRRSSWSYTGWAIRSGCGPRTPDARTRRLSRSTLTRRMLRCLVGCYPG